MAIVHSKSRTKPTGGLRRLHRKKKKFDLGRPFVPVIVGEETRKTIRTKGGNTKERLLKAETVNICHGKKTIRATVKKVVENSSNPFFVRRNIITKGAIIETDKGYARVTSRPGQDGQLSAILLKTYEPVKKLKKKKAVHARKAPQAGKSTKPKKAAVAKKAPKEKKAKPVKKAAAKKKK